MRIIISPAKKMRVDEDNFAWKELPRFLHETERILEVLRTMSDSELQQLWKCNDALAKLNAERIVQMELRKHLTPAVFAYEGIQYQYMAPGVLEQGQLDYLQEHLRILSGFYGILRPFDGVRAYRLEMQAKLAVDGEKNLYGFWGRRLADALSEESGCIVNLASKEYSKSVEPYLPQQVRLLTCTFVEQKGNKLVEKGTACKMARGQMVRWMAEHRIENPEQIRAFDDMDYHFSVAESRENEFVFVKGDS